MRRLDGAFAVYAIRNRQPVRPNEANRHFDWNKPMLLLFRFLLRNRSACGGRNLSIYDSCADRLPTRRCYRLETQNKGRVLARPPFQLKFTTYNSKLTSSPATSLQSPSVGRSSLAAYAPIARAASPSPPNRLPPFRRHQGHPAPCPALSSVARSVL